MQAAFAAFGLSVEDIEKLAPAELFDRIAESVSKTGANAKVTASAMDLFGKAGGNLIPLLSEFSEQSKRGIVFTAQSSCGLESLLRGFSR
jgi:hypothetical protein